MAWMRMIKEHIISSAHIEKDDLDYAPFDGKGAVERASSKLVKEGKLRFVSPRKGGHWEVLK